MKRLQGAKATRHARERIKERLGIEKIGKQNELVRLAFKNGITFKKYEIQTEVLDYVMHKYRKYHTAKHWRIYKNFLYLFSFDHALITVYEMPKKFHDIFYEKY